MPPIKVSADDLELALDTVSGSAVAEVSAYVARTSGKVVLIGLDDGEEEAIEGDVDDPDQYVPVPDRKELDLGRYLVNRFIEQNAPKLESRVEEIFQRRGAYQRFKALLSDHGLLDAWYAFDNAAVQEALRAWASDHGFELE
ncbi:UPF0158 family protein [Ahniella affigens]|uniref:UPF0158 family protein n=1 Tax=Ahniella affigens TaxID=2021234 RepID=UPI001475766F|nr:UPF0158 family protein [Ahniella affigens]